MDSVTVSDKEEDQHKKLLKLKVKINLRDLVAGLADLRTLVLIISETWVLSVKNHSPSQDKGSDIVICFQ